MLYRRYTGGVQEDMRGGVQEEDIRCTNASLMMHRWCVNDV